MEVKLQICLNPLIIIMNEKQGKVWTKDEDQMLVKFYRQADCFQKWKFVSSLFRENGILKTQLQCRDRFVNFINPKLKPGKLSQEEIVKLFECYNEYGPQWSFFETKIKGRSQNKLKNMFYSLLRSLLRMFVKIGQKRKLCPYEIKFQKIRVNNLLDMYQGRKNYGKIRGFFTQCLENIGYSIKRHKLQKFLNSHNAENLKIIYTTIYEQHQLSYSKNSNDDPKVDDQLLSQRNCPENQVGNVIPEQKIKLEQQFAYGIPSEMTMKMTSYPVPGVGSQNMVAFVGVNLPFQYANPYFTYSYNYFSL